MDVRFVIFGLLFVLAGIAGKVLGCGFGARITGFKMKDSFRCGVGMMCRAEVCLICAQKGIDAGIIDASIQPFILIIILLTSFATPIILKQTYKNDITDQASEMDSAPMVENPAPAQVELANTNHEGPFMDQQ